MKIVFSQHESAARTMADVGGVAFLSGLRNNLATRESRALCENILEHLCALPHSDTNNCNYNCSYSPRGGSGETSDEGVRSPFSLLLLSAAFP